MIRTLLAATAIAAAAIGMAPTASADPVADLYALMPWGYRGEACQTVTPPNKLVLAEVHCSSNSEPGGPAAADYSLLNSPQDARQLCGDFYDGRATTAGFTPGACTGSSDNKAMGWPGRPYLSSTGPGGLLACGTTRDGNASVIYTNGPLAGVTVGGPDLDTLFEWWLDVVMQ